MRRRSAILTLVSLITLAGCGSSGELRRPTGLAAGSGGAGAELVFTGSELAASASVLPDGPEARRRDAAMVYRDPADDPEPRSLYHVRRVRLNTRDPDVVTVFPRRGEDRRSWPHWWGW